MPDSESLVLYVFMGLGKHCRKFHHHLNAGLPRFRRLKLTGLMNRSWLIHEPAVHRIRMDRLSLMSSLNLTSFPNDG